MTFSTSYRPCLPSFSRALNRLVTVDDADMVRSGSLDGDTFGHRFHRYSVGAGRCLGRADIAAGLVDVALVVVVGQAVKLSFRGLSCSAPYLGAAVGGSAAALLGLSKQSRTDWARHCTVALLESMGELEHLVQEVLALPGALLRLSSFGLGAIVGVTIGLLVLEPAHHITRKLDATYPSRAYPALRTYPIAQQRAIRTAVEGLDFPVKCRELYLQRWLADGALVAQLAQVDNPGALASAAWRVRYDLEWHSPHDFTDIMAELCQFPEEQWSPLAETRLVAHPNVLTRLLEWPADRRFAVAAILGCSVSEELEDSAKAKVLLDLLRGTYFDSAQLMHIAQKAAEYPRENNPIVNLYGLFHATHAPPTSQELAQALALCSQLSMATLDICGKLFPCLADCLRYAEHLAHCDKQTWPQFMVQYDGRYLCPKSLPAELRASAKAELTRIKTSDNYEAAANA